MNCEGAAGQRGQESLNTEGEEAAFLGCRYQTTSEYKLRIISVCRSEESIAWINESLIITCSFELWKFNKSNYQFKTHVWSLTRDNILVYDAQWL